MYSSMLYHFELFDLTLNNIVTFKSGLEVTQGHWNWYHSKAWCGFLFAFHSNHGRIFNRLWDIQRQNIAWPWKLS